MNTPISIVDQRFSKPMEVTDKKELEEIYRLRARVWSRTGLAAANAFPKGRWTDTVDDYALHWVIRAGDGRAVAAARLSLHESLGEVPEPEQYVRYGLCFTGPIAAPGRVVVSPEFQRLGLGRKLLDIQEAAAEKANAKYAVRIASSSLLAMVKRRGWRVLGPALPDPMFPRAEFTTVVLDVLTNSKNHRRRR